MSCRVVRVSTCAGPQKLKRQALNDKYASIMDQLYDELDDPIVMQQTLLSMLGTIPHIARVVCRVSCVSCVSCASCASCRVCRVVVCAVSCADAISDAAGNMSENAEKLTQEGKALTLRNLGMDSLTAVRLVSQLKDQYQGTQPHPHHTYARARTHTHTQSDVCSSPGTIGRASYCRSRPCNGTG